jgi:uncharacterized protein YjiS (DUF1127 family)
MLKKLFDWMAAVVRQHNAYNELRRLDDRMLRDIGLDRSRLRGY